MLDFDECSCSGKGLGRLLQPAIMTLLAQEPLHGYRIVQRLKQMAMFKDRPPDSTGVYRLLKSMEEDGIVTSAWDLADSGPARRQYKVTKAGMACLAKWQETLEDYAAAIAELLASVKQRA